MKWKRPVRQRQVLSGENQPDLSRKIYPVCHRHLTKIKGIIALPKSDSSASKKKRSRNIRWVITILLSTILISGTISLVSDVIMESSTILVAFVILLAIVLIGIIFDVVGVAVTSADEKPFHSMAARKINGAQESIRLLRNAEQVSSICNDVVGDICGVVSGSASATIAVQLLQQGDFSWPQLVNLLLSALVAGLTVGGKAIGKVYAIGSCTKIVIWVGRLIWSLKHIPEIFKRNKS
jgi:hypothetical protein